MKNDYTYRLLLTVVFICLSICPASAKVINAQIFNSGANSTIKIIDYGIIQRTIDSNSIVNNNAVLDMGSINSGVYRVEIERENRSIINFDVIIDESENNFSLSFNCISESEMPSFLFSPSNTNWYDFMEKQNFRIKVINFLMQKNQNSNLSNEIDKKEVCEKERTELLQMQLDFIKRNDNFWSTQMIKADYARLVSKSKKDYYSNFELTNPKLINTPIFLIAIQNYIIKYCNPQEFCKVDREKLLKDAFEETIVAFSDNWEVKKWALENIVFGLKQMNLTDLRDYFYNKYLIN